MGSAFFGIWNMENNTISIEPDQLDNLNAIQKAVDSFGPEGGTIRLEKGKHMSGPLKLKSGTFLYLEKGAELVFSDDFTLYPPVLTRWEGTECYALQSLIFAEGCHDIRIGGEGVINGSGNRWWTSYRALRNGEITPEIRLVQKKLAPLNEGRKGGSGGGGKETNFLRPSLVQFKDCTEVEIEGVTLKDSPFWNTHILYCRNVRLKGLTFINPPDAPNTDGLDIDSSEHVSVEDCLFDVGDDCLCLKSGMDDDGILVGRPTAEIKISNCTMNKGHGAVVIGSETSGGIRNVTIENCRMAGTDRGIRVKTRRGRGGTIENITIRNIEMNGVTAPIVMNMFYRCGTDASEQAKLKVLAPLPFDELRTPVIKNITIDNITARGVRSSAAFLMGLPESMISHIRIRDVFIVPDEANVFEEPAMDLFYTKADGPAILHKFLNDIHLSNIHIEGRETAQWKEILC